MGHGNFIISLDFELMWGVRDKLTKEQYGKNILGVHQVIPRLLETFRKFEIRATFSTVGFLFCRNKDELTESIPVKKPGYNDQNLSPYNGYFDLVGDNDHNDPYHYATSLITKIQKYPEQEIGTHTFSHYYCLEEGQTIDDFKADIEAAIKIAQKRNIKLTSLVFPRNQFNDEYLKVCAELGIICYRGNELSWLYVAKNGKKETLLRRAFRLVDSYFSISGHNCYSDAMLKNSFPVNIPSSRFLRPYTSKLKYVERLRMQRIKSGMTYAAKNNLTYHLWWHPHNFGDNQNENFLFLEKILTHYKFLNEQFKFESITMSNFAQKLING
ncbi:MAG: polysaccharide deacetylase family protein [Saprospiraceae bacterium]|nr:polysaccharide deacetylase family protein [Saprospiraceae bacterium]